MIRLRFSMRFTLGATVALMGVVGMMLALATGEIYRKQALDNQRAALEELAQLGVTERLRELEERARDLGLALQSEPRFRQAVVRGDRQLLTRELRNQFHQYFVTANIIKLDKLVAYDAGYRPLGMASAASEGDTEPGCAELIQRARLRNGTARLHTASTLCLGDRQPRHAVLVPIGGLQVIGFLEVVTDPVPVLAQIETKLGFPVRVRAADGRTLFVSDAWPPPDAMHNALVAETSLADPAGKPVIKVAVMRDVEPLQDGLRHTRYVVMMLAAAATLLGVVLALTILENSTLRPLKALTEQLRRVRSNRDHLGEQVEVDGIAEMRELAEDFNQMARELDRLYGSLEHMAFTDPLTNLPNRARFRDSLEESARQHARARQPFALFLMDLDRFKGVNDTLGHQVGDLLLQEVSTRLRGVLRESDTVARLDNAAIHDLGGEMVARLGGDEFAAILPRVSSVEDARTIARKLLVSMQEPFEVRGHPITIGISIGVALYPRHGEDIDTLIQRADAAMYFAKHNGCGLAFPDTVPQTPLL